MMTKGLMTSVTMPDEARECESRDTQIDFNLTLGTQWEKQALPPVIFDHDYFIVRHSANDEYFNLFNSLTHIPVPTCYNALPCCEQSTGGTFGELHDSYIHLTDTATMPELAPSLHLQNWILVQLSSTLNPSYRPYLLLSSSSYKAGPPAYRYAA